MLTDVERIIVMVPQPWMGIESLKRLAINHFEKVEKNNNNIL